MIKTVSFSPRNSSRVAPPRSNARAATRPAAVSSKMESSELKTEVQAKVKKAVPSVAAVEVEEVTSEIVESENTPAKKSAPQPKARKPRAPANLAEMYGAPKGGGAPKPAVQAEPEVAKKRLSKAEREARKELMRPSDELMQRLQRVEVFVPAKKKREPRVAGWRFECGCCGRVSHFQTAGALCQCGAIAVKEGLN